MSPAEVPAELVEKAAQEVWGPPGLRWSDVVDEDFATEGRDMIRTALVAVLPEVQAQALEEAATTVVREVGIVWPSQRHADIGEAANYAAEVLRANARAEREGKHVPYAARLATTTEEPTT